MYLEQIIGGSLIGLSAVVLMLTIGKIAGCSGAVAGIVKLKALFNWQHAFIVGIVLGGIIATSLLNIEVSIRGDFPIPLLILSGLIVGFGTQLGNGCTSGHGVCGISRKSGRSIIATILFMLSAIVTVTLVNGVIAK